MTRTDSILSQKKAYLLHTSRNAGKAKTQNSTKRHSTPLKNLAALSLISLGSVGFAQDFTPPAQNALSDIGGSWASSAVITLQKYGVMNGYPDGTFQGNKSVSRYELAATLSRLLRSGLLSRQDSADVQAALSAVQKEMETQGNTVSTLNARLSDTLGELDTLSRRSQEQGDLLNKVSSQYVSSEELKGLQEKETRQDALIAALSDKVDQLSQESQISKTAISGSNGIKSADLAPASSSSTPATPTDTQEAQAMQAAKLVTGQTFESEAIPQATFKQDDGSDHPYYFGVGAAYDAGQSYAIKAVIGSERITKALNLGLEGNVAYYPDSKSYGAEIGVLKHFGVPANRFSPYLGLGIGLTNGPAKTLTATTSTASTTTTTDSTSTTTATTKTTDTTSKTSDLFAQLTAGVNYNFTDSMRLYAEITPRYYFSTKSTISGGDSNATTGGMKLSAGAGVKIYF